jgi:hypothetical protein
LIQESLIELLGNISTNAITIVRGLLMNRTQLNWGNEVPNVLAPEQITAIKQAFQGSSLIVEHRFLNGGSRPDGIVFDDYEDFEEYLHAKVRPGDSLWFWRYNDLCRDDNAITYGKYPDAEGKVPSGGAY